MKSTFIFSLCCAIISVHINSMNICLMHESHEETPAPAQQSEPAVKPFSQDMQKFQDALQVLNNLQNNQKACYRHRKADYEEQLKVIEQLAKQSSEKSVQRDAHFTLGKYAYYGYRPTYQTARPFGIDFKKALAHFICVNNNIELNRSKSYAQQQAEAYFLQGKIYAVGESCFFGCIQRVKVDHEQAITCFTLAQEWAEENTPLQVQAALESAALNLLSQEDD